MTYIGDEKLGLAIAADEQLLREALEALEVALVLGNRVAERDPFLFAMDGADVIVRSQVLIPKLEQRLLHE